VRLTVSGTGRCGGRILKASILLSAALWCAWLVSQEPPFAIALPLFPFVLLVWTWDKLNGSWLRCLTLTILASSSVYVGLAYKQSTSSTAGVGLMMQIIFASAIVVIARLASKLLAKRRRARGRES